MVRADKVGADLAWYRSRGDLAVLAAAAATGADATFVGPATLGDVAVAALLRG